MSLQHHIAVPASPGFAPCPPPAPDEAHRRFAHELANLLDGAMRNLSLARADLQHVALEPDTCLRISTTADAMQRMTALLRRFLAGPAHEPSRLFWNNATLADTLAHLVVMLEPEARQRSVVLRLDLDAAAADLPAGAAWSPMVNVVRNAIEISPPGSCVTIFARSTGDMASIDVCDQGPGFHPRLDRDADGLPAPGITTRPGGHGLGLALSRQILQQMGGSLTLADRAHGGTIAKLRWPHVIPNEPLDDLADLAADTAPTPTPASTPGPGPRPDSEPLSP
jgi:signal transduction histidine kinase